MAQTPIVTQLNNVDQPAYNVTGAVVVRTGKAILRSVVVNAPGSSGTLTPNDNSQTGATNTAANTIISISFGSLTAGQIVSLNNFCQTVITVSAVPVGGAFSILTL